MIDAQAVAQAEHLLAHMRAAIQAAQGASVGPLAAEHNAGPGAFASVLAHSLEKVSQVETRAYSQAKSFDQGAPGIHLSDVMVDLQKANMAFQMTVQVRNRLIEAYKEIASLAI